MEPEGFVPRHSTLLLVLEGLFNQGSGQTSFNLLASWVITFGKAPDTPSRSPVPSTAKPRRCKAGTEVGKGVQAPWKGQKKSPPGEHSGGLVFEFEEIVKGLIAQKSPKVNDLSMGRAAPIPR